MWWIIAIIIILALIFRAKWILWLLWFGLLAFFAWGAKDSIEHDEISNLIWIICGALFVSVIFLIILL